MKQSHGHSKCYSYYGPYVVLKISGSLQRTGILVCLGGILGQVGAAAEEPAREPLADARVGDVNPGGFGSFQRLGALF